MNRIVFSFVLLLGSLSANAQLEYKGYVSKTHAAQSVVSSSGDFLYLTHDHKLSAFTVDQRTGKLKATQEISHRTGGEFGNLTVSSDNRFLYANIGMNSTVKTPLRSIAIYSIDQKTGKLTLKRSLENDPEFQNEFLSHFSVSPKKNLLFIGDDEDKLLKVYRLNAETGMPEHLYTNSTETFRGWSNIVVSPDQKNIYLKGGNSHKEVVTFSLNERTGVVKKIQEIDYLDRWSRGSDIIISADGKNVYTVSGNKTEKIIQFKRDQNSGILEVQHSYTNLKPANYTADYHFLYADRNTDFLYAFKTFGDGDAMHVIQRDPSTGNLSYKETFYDKGETNKLNGAFKICFSKDNRYAYVSGTWDGALNIFYNPKARLTQDFESSEEEVLASNESYPTTSSTSTGPNNSEPASSTADCNGQEVSSAEFKEIWSVLSSEESDIARLEKAFEHIEGKCMKVVQAAALSYLFNSEYKRLEFVKFVSYFLHDQENLHLLAEVFQYDRMKEEVLSL